ncbi:MAG: SGNH/GDSL hydrolase family protein [Acidobacteriota bacterium]|nr:SGNH/GDSL hydrolase family protein [Acidobacteriota bacterium]
MAVIMTVVQAQQSVAPANKWEAEIKKYEEADRRNPPAKDAVLFIGSSSIRLWQSLAQDFPQVKVLNRGFGGSEIADSTFYVDRMIVPYQPRMILLYAGDNDIANNKTPQKVVEDYKAFVSRVRQKLPITRIAFISIKPSPARASLLESMRQANEMIKDYVSHDQSLVYIDVFSPMLGVNGKPRPELFGPDNLHMNEEGYRLWKSVIAPYLR